MIGVGNYYFLKANTKAGTHVDEPLRIPRPGDDDREDSGAPATREELLSYFGSKMIVRYTPKTDGTESMGS